VVRSGCSPIDRRFEFEVDVPTTRDAGAGETVSSGLLDATFLPELGMVGVSLRHAGRELLALPGGVDGYRAGNVTGLPLLAPWANRLGSSRYEVGDVVVDLDGLALHTDGHGLPIHGTMSARAGWEVVAAASDRLSARFDFGAHADLLASFPFPHELTIDVAVAATALTVDTTVVPTSERSVPLSFGYHPYLRLPTARRADVHLRLPARRHIELDARGLPTGATHDEDAEDEPLGPREFDDLYELGDERRVALAGDGRAVTLDVGDGYRYAQVFAPASADFVCLEPMTAPVNALVDGGYQLVPPGESFTARFALLAEDDR
jgi:aldose 1-epimerase